MYCSVSIWKPGVKVKPLTLRLLSLLLGLPSPVGFAAAVSGIFRYTGMLNSCAADFISLE